MIKFYFCLQRQKQPVQIEEDLISMQITCIEIDRQHDVFTTAFSKLSDEIYDELMPMYA